MAFEYLQGMLGCEGVSLAEIAAEVGTPFYVYSLDEVERRYQAYEDAFPGALIAYAFKANPSLALVSHLARLGCGADVVSRGELARALHAGIPAARIVVNGNGKTRADIEAAVAAGVRVLNLDAAEEVPAVSDAARRLGRIARVAVRVNPDVDVHTHRHITTGLHSSKFGVPLDQVRKLYGEIACRPELRPVGIHYHLGSQILDMQPLRKATEDLATLAGDLLAQGIALEHVDVGGGLGIDYGAPGTSRGAPDPAALAEAILPVLGGLGLSLVLEPGRSIVGPAGALVAEVQLVKRGLAHPFVVLDAGINALIRPALYHAYHRIWPVHAAAPAMIADVVGPICESADVLGRERELPALERGDLLAVLDAGAYGASMASTYNGQPRPAEVVVHDGRWRVARERERVEDLWARELDFGG